MQAQYLRATMDYWAQAANNPTSTQYSGRMLDIARLYAWAWDARPYPAFPANRELWSDGVNYSRGHWLNGRASNQLTSAVMADICEKSGVEDVELDQAHGIVRGYTISNLATARSDLQPLTLTAGIDGLEREGALVFRGRSAWGASPVAEDSVALNGDLDGTIDFTRQSSAETTGRLRLGFVQVDGDFASRTVEVSFPDETSDVTSVNELPLTLTSSEAKSIAERWLSEARAARDTLRLALPPSRLPLGVGDVMSVNGQSYRIDGLEASDMQLLSATRIHQGLYSPGDEIDDPPIYSAVSSPTAVYPVFMDLPLLTGDELPHAPHFAAVSSPWLGTVAIWSSDSDAGYTVTGLAERGATFGLTESVLAQERTGLWERGAPLRVKLSSGSLASAAQNAVLSGANTLVIGDGTPANWEVFQFRDATLIGPKTYELTMRLRGQAGSNGIMPATWPSGSQVVLIDSSVLQLDLASSTRSVSRHYRTGLASLGYADSRTAHQELAFTGIGYRPYSVAHLNVTGQIGAPVTLGWIRRTRIDGDPWTESEVPLGEDRERYLVRVKQGATVLREVEVTAPGWTYTSGDQSADGAVSPVTISVAQLSDRVGAGPFATVSV